MDNRELKRILCKYDNILVQIKNSPRLFTKKIIFVQSINDLINVKNKVNKPIYYILTDNSCDFIFLGNDVYIYTFKGNNIEKSLIEEYIDKLDKSEFNIIKDIKEDAYVSGSDGSEYIVMPLEDENEKTII